MISFNNTTAGQSIREYIADFWPDVIFLGTEEENYDEAIIGVSEDPDRLVYDYKLIVEEVYKQATKDIPDEAMTQEIIEYQTEAAYEWVDFNTIRSLPYAGENGPIVMHHIKK